MKSLRRILDQIHSLFEEGRPLARLYPLYEAAEGFFFAHGAVTKGPSHIRDAIDLKRIMYVVVLALLPCAFAASYLTGWQSLNTLEKLGLGSPIGWRADGLAALGLSLTSSSWLANLLWGASFYVPLYLCSFLVGAFWEILFAVLRRKEINEGFLVTSMLFPLTLPPTLPLWQAALGISFGVVLGKEIFGGTGRNFMNPALVGRAFLYFAYPAQLSGDSVWLAFDTELLKRVQSIDASSGATALSIAASEGILGLQNAGLSWFDCFLGYMPGSLGETSKLACLLGASLLIYTRLASWQIMAGVLFGSMSLASLLYAVGSPTHPIFSLPPHWHLVLGSLVFGTVFMATDPVSAAMSKLGRWLYGFLIGFMIIIIRCFNPAFPEGVMLAILFGNACAPLLDYLVLRRHIRWRKRREGSL